MELHGDGQASPASFIAWDAVASLALTDNAYNFIYVDGTDGRVKATTNFYSISFTQDFTVGRVYRSGTTVTIRLCGTNAWNFNRRVQLFGEEVFPIVRATGLILSGTGTRNIAITAGVLWAELVNHIGGFEGLVPRGETPRARMDEIDSLIAAQLQRVRQDQARLQQVADQMHEELARVEATLHFRRGQAAALEELARQLAAGEEAPAAPSDNK